jgi:hypothetical protein
MAEIGGPARDPSSNTEYLHYPDGHSEYVAHGTLGHDPLPEIERISAGGGHIIFDSRVRLEEDAPIEGSAVYDRTSDGVTHVVSLLPGNQTTSQPAHESGSSSDGRGIAWASSGALYLRYNNEETFKITEGNFGTYAVADSGKRVIYGEEGKLLAFDLEAGVIPFVSSGNPTVVNLSRDGTTAYFVSTSKLTSTPNPVGDKPKGGQENLYLSREGAIKFLGTVTERDVVGEVTTNGSFDGLGLWAKYNRIRTMGAVPRAPSRISQDGKVLLFESRASLTGYENDGKAEIYRYDEADNTLDCLSCNPTGLPASADASLQSVLQDGLGPEPVGEFDQIENLSSDGRRAIFQSPEALVAGDVDGLQDVYEWEAPGVGTCADPQGCVSLLSSGHSSADDYLYGTSESGDDVFIQTADRLVPERDPDETRSIYDARVGGGFASTTQSAECLGEACQPTAVPPERPAQLLNGSGNAPRRIHCPKGKRAVHRGGTVRCIKPKPHRHRSKRKHKHGKQGRKSR